LFSKRSRNLIVRECHQRQQHQQIPQQGFQNAGEHNAGVQNAGVHNASLGGAGARVLGNSTIPTAFEIPHSIKFSEQNIASSLLGKPPVSVLYMCVR